MPEFDKAIPPGGEGNIKLSIDTKKLQGKVHKSARVYTNDPHKKMFVLSLKGFVKVPIYVTPRSVYFYFNQRNVGKVLTRTVRINAGLDRPLQLTQAEYDLEGKLAYAIKELKEGKEFQIQFTNLLDPPERFNGKLKLKTNYPEHPEIVIWARSRLPRPKESKEK